MLFHDYLALSRQYYTFCSNSKAVPPVPPHPNLMGGDRSRGINRKSRGISPGARGGTNPEASKNLKWKPWGRINQPKPPKPSVLTWPWSDLDQTRIGVCSLGSLRSVGCRTNYHKKTLHMSTMDSEFCDLVTKDNFIPISWERRL